VCCGFLSLLKSIALAGFEPATFMSSGKHTNHYTTKVTFDVLVPGAIPTQLHIFFNWHDSPHSDPEVRFPARYRACFGASLKLNDIIGIFPYVNTFSVLNTLRGTPIFYWRSATLYKNSEWVSAHALFIRTV
jgi:hypothetical protein